jgi:hypothetical protein
VECLGNADFPWRPSIGSNRTVIGTTGHSSAGMRQKHFTTPPIFFEKPIWNRARRGAAPGPLKQCLALKASRFILCAASWSWPADRSADGRTDGRPSGMTVITGGKGTVSTARLLRSEAGSPATAWARA